MTWWQGVKMILCRLHCSSTSQKLVDMSCILVIPQTARDSSKSSKAMAIPWPWRFTFHGFCDFPRAFHWPCQHCCEYSSVTRVANVSSIYGDAYSRTQNKEEEEECISIPIL